MGDRPKNRRRRWDVPGATDPRTGGGETLNLITSLPRTLRDEHTPKASQARRNGPTTRACSAVNK